MNTYEIIPCDLTTGFILRVYYTTNINVGSNLTLREARAVVRLLAYTTINAATNAIKDFVAANVIILP